MKSSRKKTPSILLAEEQVQYIEGLIDSALLSDGKTPEFIARLRALRAELDKAAIVPAGDLPPDVVRVASWVEYEDLADGTVEQFQLVYPEYADLSLGRISLMTPMGIAILGEQSGRDVTYQAPSGTHTIHLRRVSNSPFEPEGRQQASPQAELE